MYMGSIGDDEQAFVDTLNVSTDARIVISSGAVSMGKWDFIPDLLKKMVPASYFGVGIKPGKPILFAVLKTDDTISGSRATLFQRPLACASLSTTHSYAIRHAAQPFHYARLRHDFQKKGDLRNFLKARLDSDDHGQTHLTILDGRQSFKISPLLDMNCWAIINERQNELCKDDSVCIAPMGQHHGLLNTGMNESITINTNVWCL